MKAKDIAFIQECVNLRRSGKSLREIALKLQCSKSTALRYVGHIPLLPRHRMRLYRFSPGITMNPERRNALWRYLREKRAILEDAITSYVAK